MYLKNPTTEGVGDRRQDACLHSGPTRQPARHVPQTHLPLLLGAVLQGNAPPKSIHRQNCQRKPGHAHLGGGGRSQRRIHDTGLVTSLIFTLSFSRLFFD